MPTKTVELSEEDIEKIKAICKKQDRSRSYVTRQAIREYWEKHYESDTKSIAKNSEEDQESK